MNLKFGSLILGLISGILFSSCVSISVYQTGKTLPQGDWEFGLAYGNGVFSNKTRLSSDFPAIGFYQTGELWLRYGITNHLDAGVKASLPGGMTGDLKVGLSNEERGHSLSLATGFGYTQATNDSESKTIGRTDKTKIEDFIFPFYISKDLIPAITLYLTPRYVHRITTNTRDQTGKAQSKEIFRDPMLGLGGGLMLNFGRHVHLALEYQRLSDLDESTHESHQAGLGLAFNF